MMGWLLLRATELTVLFVVVIGTVAAFAYMLPTTVCDSSCWTNPVSTRILGLLGVIMAPVVALALPALVWLVRRTRLSIRRSGLILVTLTLLSATWWVLGQAMLDRAPAS